MVIILSSSLMITGCSPLSKTHQDGLIGYGDKNGKTDKSPGHKEMGRSAEKTIGMVKRPVIGLKKNKQAAKTEFNAE